MIKYVCDICGKSIPKNKLVELKFVAGDVKKCRHICYSHIDEVIDQIDQRTYETAGLKSVPANDMPAVYYEPKVSPQDKYNEEVFKAKALIYTCMGLSPSVAGKHLNCAGPAIGTIKLSRYSEDMQKRFDEGVPGVTDGVDWKALMSMFAAGMDYDSIAADCDAEKDKIEYIVGKILYDQDSIIYKRKAKGTKVV